MGHSLLKKVRDNSLPLDTSLPQPPDSDPIFEADYQEAMAKKKALKAGTPDSIDTQHEAEGGTDTHGKDHPPGMDQ